MATRVVTKDYNASTEGLADAGNAANITFAANTGDGSPSADSLKFTAGAGLASSETEYARNPTTTGTWESEFGATPGDVITNVQITAIQGRSNSGGVAINTVDFSARITDASRASILSADLLAVSAGGWKTTWLARSAGSSRSVNGGSQASNSVALIEYQLTSDEPSRITYIDTVEYTITYTPAALAPLVGALAITGYAPVVSALRIPSLGSLAITGIAPGIATTINPVIKPGVGSLALWGYAPTPGSYNLTPLVGSLKTEGFQSSLASTSSNIVPGRGELVFASDPVPPIPPPPGTFYYSFYDFPGLSERASHFAYQGDPGMRVDVFNNIVACAYCTPAAVSNPLDFYYWDLWVAINRSPLDTTGNRWIVTKMKNTLVKTNLGLCFLPNGWLFLTYDIPDGDGGYKAVRQYNYMQGDPLGWSGEADWIQHGVADAYVEQAARFTSVVHANQTLYKFRSTYKANDPNPDHSPTISFDPHRMSRLTSTDGTTWGAEEDVTVDYGTNYTFGTQNGRAIAGYWGNEFEIDYESAYGLVGSKTGNPHSFPLPPVGGTSGFFVEDQNRQFIRAGGAGILAHSLGSDDVRWIIGNKYTGGRCVYRDRSLGRNTGDRAASYKIEEATAAPNPNANSLPSYYLVTLCTVGAIPVLIRANYAIDGSGLAYDGVLKTACSFDGGATWVNY